MVNVLELQNQLRMICNDLKDQSAVLQSLAAKVEQASIVTANVMNQTSRVDVAQAAVSGINGAQKEINDAALLLNKSRELLETYASQI